MSGLTTGQKISDELRLLLAANVRCGSEVTFMTDCFKADPIYLSLYLQNSLYKADRFKLGL